ncbi:hypothetical protein K3725_17575 [Leisingera sp. S132]|uniref:hypothetical protein n=1 Tax=Leisingera sp. S132 TaxID=2867016 RepID=UPI0021A4D986|nr:hypothetical protein [Leisingera sp. S132]UWQ79083.1 hypothetical protein K3725_17575 [Leisingera sp. S132]
MAETGKTKTHCIGRLLVEVPTEFEVLRHDGTVRARRVERIGPGDERDLQQITADRVRALRNKEVIEAGDPKIFLGTEDLNGVTGIKSILDTSVMGVQISEPWDEEAFVLSEGVIFRLYGVASEERLASHRRSLSLVANAIRPRAQGEISVGEGTCLENSFFALAPGNEQIGATFVHASERAILLRVSTSVRDPGNGTLDFSAIQGTDGEPVRIAGFEGKELRLWDGPVNLSAIVGQQPGADRPGYKITLEYSDSRKETGSPPFTREEARSFWESFTGSIQVKK